MNQDMKEISILEIISSCRFHTAFARTKKRKLEIMQHSLEAIENLVLEKI